MTDAYEQLQEQVRRVADLRRAHAAEKEMLDKERAAFNALNSELIDAVAATGEAVEHAEHALRTLAVSHFQVTGEAKPTQGVEVKQYVSFEYKVDRAFEWCAKKEIAIKPASLDVKAFEAVVKALPALPEFCREIVTPKAQISTNLDKVLGLESAPATVEAQ